VHVEIRTADFGAMQYILGFALADILNKKHSWIRASAVETFGSVDNVKTVGADEKKRARTIFLLNPYIGELAQKGSKPFDKAYPDLRMVMSNSVMGDTFLTLDPEIKSYQDLAGKRINPGPKGQAKSTVAQQLVKSAGMGDQVKWTHMGITAGKNALMDGTVDAIWVFINNFGPGVWNSPPYVEEILAQRKAYFIPVTDEQLQKNRETYGAGISIKTVMPANALAQGVPPEDLTMRALVNGWGAYKDFPEDVMYEIVKTIDENHKMFTDYHPAGGVINPDNYGIIPWSENQWHPGAIKYYKEKGIKFGG
jgi:hypothetical protein